MQLPPREKQARGWSIGVFVGLSMPPGTHFFFAWPLALWFKGSVPAALSGVFVTNPLTVLIIYPFQTWLGNLILGGNLDWASLKVLFKDIEHLHDIRMIFTLGGDVFASYFLGGIILAVPAGLITYFAIRYVGKKKAREEGCEISSRTEKTKHTGTDHSDSSR